MRYLIFCLTACIFTLSGEVTTNSLRKFLEKDASLVKDCQDNRVYLKAERLTIQNDGIYLLDELNNQIPLAELFSDSQGIYTRAESLETELATVWNIVWCRTCMDYRTTTIGGKCSKCGNIP